MGAKGKQGNRRALARRDRAKRKELRIASAKKRGDVAGRSTYAQKIARKLGSGRIEPGWMWYASRES